VPHVAASRNFFRGSLLPLLLLLPLLPRHSFFNLVLTKYGVACSVLSEYLPDGVYLFEETVDESGKVSVFSLGIAQGFREIVQAFLIGSLVHEDIGFEIGHLCHKTTLESLNGVCQMSFQLGNLNLNWALVWQP
ncbi:hypothetical protein TVAG_540630, partial [Trichomonas vaginalis G3]